jgi:hypothetical protein
MCIKLDYCEKCGAMVRSFCISCGKVVTERPCNCGKETMYCPRCGVDGREIKFVFCEKCGRLFKKVCSVCGETISEKPCNCEKQEVSGDSPEASDGSSQHLPEANAENYPPRNNISAVEETAMPSCPFCGADDIWITLLYCNRCGKLIKKVCAICGETISEKPCGCTQEEMPGDSVN